MYDALLEDFIRNNVRGYDSRSSYHHFAVDGNSAATALLSISDPLTDEPNSDNPVMIRLFGTWFTKENFRKEGSIVVSWVKTTIRSYDSAVEVWYWKLVEIDGQKTREDSWCTRQAFWRLQDKIYRELKQAGS